MQIAIWVRMVMLSSLSIGVGIESLKYDSFILLMGSIALLIMAANDLHTIVKQERNHVDRTE